MNVARYQAEKIAKEALKRVEQQVEAAEADLKSFVYDLTEATISAKVLAFFNDKKCYPFCRLRSYARFSFVSQVAGEEEIQMDNTIYYFPSKLRLPDDGEFTLIKHEDYLKVVKLFNKHQEDRKQSQKDRDTLEDALVACRTFKKAAERYPDLVSFFPKEQTNLPAKVYDTSAIQTIIDNAKPLGQ